MKISSTFVAFLENMNFTSLWNGLMEYEAKCLKFHNFTWFFLQRQKTFLIRRDFDAVPLAKKAGVKTPE